MPERASAANPARGGGGRRDLAVIGASAGGVEALTALVRSLSADVSVAFLVVLHVPAGGTSRLPDILGRVGPLPASFARHGETPEPGHIYVAPPDSHLTLSGSRMYVIDGPRENGFRPAIDPLFRSAARWAGRRAIGILLSGTMDDGAAGMAAIQSFGGATIVQDPDDALAPGMPEAALQLIEPDRVVAAAGMGRAIDEVAADDLPSEPPNGDTSLVADPLVLEAEGMDLTCPQCGGALQEVKAGPVSRYRCRVGHVLSPESLLGMDAETLESALWAALRSLEEMATVSSRLAVRSRDLGATSAARRFEARQADAASRADLVRQAIVSVSGLSGTPESAISTESPTIDEGQTPPTGRPAKPAGSSEAARSSRGASRRIARRPPRQASSID